MAGEEASVSGGRTELPEGMTAADAAEEDEEEAAADNNDNENDDPWSTRRFRALGGSRTSTSPARSTVVRRGLTPFFPKNSLSLCRKVLLRDRNLRIVIREESERGPPSPQLPLARLQ